MDLYINFISTMAAQGPLMADFYTVRFLSCELMGLHCFVFVFPRQHVAHSPAYCYNGTDPEKRGRRRAFIVRIKDTAKYEPLDGTEQISFFPPKASNPTAAKSLSVYRASSNEKKYHSAWQYKTELKTPFG